MKDDKNILEKHFQKCSTLYLAELSSVFLQSKKEKTNENFR